MCRNHLRLGNLLWLLGVGRMGEVKTGSWDIPEAMAVVW